MSARSSIDPTRADDGIDKSSTSDTANAAWAPGDVYILPPFADPVLQDPIRHWHMVLSSAETSRKFVTLAYASSSRAEHDSGAPAHPVHPVTAKPGANGLTKVTYFYPGILTRVRADSLVDPMPSQLLELPSVRALLCDALGCGSGPHYAQRDFPAVDGSSRGRVVELTDPVANAFRTPFAVVVTCHRYSAKRHFQTLVPLLDGELRLANASAVRIARPWVASLLGGKTSGSRTLLAPGQLVRAVWSDKHVKDDTRYTLDADDLQAVEQAVRNVLAPLAGV